MNGGCWVVLCVGMFLLSFRAPAGPPFLTDDPEPVKKDHGEFYISSQHTWSRDDRSGTVPHFELNYGPIDDIQLHMIAPFAYDRPNAGKATQYGYGDTELGIKWRPIHEDAWFKGCPQIGTFPLVELPTGDQSRGLGNGRTQAFLPLWLQKSWGEENRQWTTYGGGGYWYNPGQGNKDYWFTGALLQKQVADRLTLGGEVFHATPSQQEAASHTGFNLGGVFDISKQWHFLFSAGRDVRGDNLLTAYVGLQFTFGRSKSSAPAQSREGNRHQSTPENIEADAPQKKENHANQGTKAMLPGLRTDWEMVGK